MTRRDLYKKIIEKKSFLCVGLDTDPDKIPAHLHRYEDPIFEFNKAIIDATKDHCIAYKPNIAFYEMLGLKGWNALQKTLKYIPKTHFIIADAKRGDIGNTSERYARTFYKTFGFDALTVAPYMGEDSIRPFLKFKNKWVIVLALTSNKGSNDFQFTPQENGQPLYEKVMRKSMEWGNADQLMFVCGATHPEKFAELRTIAPDHFFLVPGVGAQGGDLKKICAYGFNEQVGLLVNSSRGIIYAGQGEDFAEASKAVAKDLHEQMKLILEDRLVI